MKKFRHVLRQQKDLLRNATYLIFKIMGLAPFAIQHPNKVTNSKDSRQDHRRVFSQFAPSYLGGLYNFCLIPVQMYLLYQAWGITNDSPFPYKSEITDKIELSITILSNGATSIIWLIYVVEQKTLAGLVNRFTQVGVTLARVKGSNIDIYKDRFGCRNYVVLIVTNTILWIVLLSTEQLAFHAPLITWFYFIVPSIIIDWFIIQYIVAINLIENRFKLLNNILVHLPMIPIAFPLRSFLNGEISSDDFQVPKLLHLRRAHTSLYEISSGVANFYSFPIFIVIGFTFLCTIYNANYLLVLIALGAENMTVVAIVNTAFWLVIQIWKLIMLVAGIHGVTKEMKKAAIVLPNLLAQPTTSRREKIELKNFALEMLHKDVAFTACRFYSLDGSLLKSMFGMVGTYLTILIQFSKNSSKAGSNSTAYNFTHARQNRTGN